MPASDAPVPDEQPRREMSPDEKLIAQWEARHDAAARGHRPDPMAVQHYLSHAHADERAHAGRPVAPAAPEAARPAPHQEVAQGEAKRPWWRRLFRRS
ncbi:hypothetical protein GCM10027451_19960 [Geodermatophilus aquaeductus]|uniref:Uncharacterized protein n=1 Tax=Geodermatophilus aquaeductus TaxID=1564161 RepID=A0A521EBB1_9ACTN|nr:hypothetical protein [Geodermatophilus aquaeductus]SMO81193.1 hypothetical protein SAMN06273567_104408 [Geodermatophilus aquaeductus]